MIPLPDVAVVIEIVAVTGSVIVIGNVAVFVTPPTVLLAEIVAVPGLTPVMIPVAPTVATDGLLEKKQACQFRWHSWQRAESPPSLLPRPCK